MKGTFPAVVRAVTGLGLILGVLVSSVAVRAEDAANAIGAAALTVTVEGALPPKGAVMVALFDSEDAFLKAPLARQAAAPSEAGIAVVTFEGLEPGVYAVSAFHDKNGNGALNRNFVGIPKEPTGASNNPKPRMGPPLFEAARFELGEAPMAISITVR